MSDQVLYEDPYVKLVLPEKPYTNGHLRIIPVKEVSSVDELSKDEVQHAFQIASIASTVLFEEMKAHGTNIILHEGPMFKGQMHWDVFARMQDDDVDVVWEPQQVSESETDDAMKAISGRLLVTPEKESLLPEKSKGPSGDSETETIDLRDKDNYLSRRLHRLP